MQLGRLYSVIHDKRFFVALGILVVIILIICAPAIKRQLNDWKLLPEPERLTELYFTHPNSLPTTYTPGQIQAVDFTVHNLEYATTKYSYVITEQSQAGGNATTLSSGNFTLLQNQYKSPTLNITPVDVGAHAKISVNLQGQDESIDYLVDKGEHE